MSLKILYLTIIYTDLKQIEDLIKIKAHEFNKIEK